MEYFETASNISKQATQMAEQLKEKDVALTAFRNGMQRIANALGMRGNFSIDQICEAVEHAMMKPKPVAEVAPKQPVEEPKAEKKPVKRKKANVRAKPKETE